MGRILCVAFPKKFSYMRSSKRRTEINPLTVSVTFWSYPELFPDLCEQMSGLVGQHVTYWVNSRSWQLWSSYSWKIHLVYNFGKRANALSFIIKLQFFVLLCENQQLITYLCSWNWLFFLKEVFYIKCNPLTVNHER